MTLTDIATKLGVDKTVAYGLVRFLEAKSLILATGTKRQPGAKGKGAKVYTLSDSANVDLQSLFAKLSV